MKVIKNLFAIFGALSMLAIVLAFCWWKGFLGSSADLDFKLEENPKRTHIAHVALTAEDVIVFQDETYDGFFGDGGGVVVARLAKPMEFDRASWSPINQFPDEYRSLLSSISTRGDEYLQPTLQDSETVWCLSQLQRNGENISNIVLFFYKPGDKIVIEWILHT